MRPELDLKISEEVFLDYYWLKEELVDFCKRNNLPRSGMKKELTDTIAHYLKTGEILRGEKEKSIKKSVMPSALSLDTIIPVSYKNDENHREFFKQVIGSHFKFNVSFMNWMKQNDGKTYQVAVNEWLRIEREKKDGKKVIISSQFEYNQYTRDFFNANSDLNREAAIICWKYKKSQAGSNKYEDRDKDIL
ncbi:MAG: DUF6434 domain-containing protein [Vallitaleaceae bacterium]|jgi:hypothetical protein|nr:DUF6434 domain-containing protein [Vallitaleaceae bacterium]